ncbi:MAG: hypothetical protein ACLKAK_09995 [Alkaliphilus sp.]
MAKVFFPKDFILVKSNSTDHPQNTEYKVSIGVEDWDGKHVEIIKVQMLYNDKVSGRKSPSFPIDTDDYNRVHDAVLRLKKKHNII